MSLLSKINITSIVKNHLNTLVNDNDKRPEFDDWLTFLIIPIVVAITLSYFDVNLNKDVVNVIITALSIFVGLLFNVVVLVFDIINKESTTAIKKRLMNEIITNISYCILLSLVAILISLFVFLDNCFVVKTISFIIYFLLSNFLVTLLMVLKRVYVLFDNESK